VKGADLLKRFWETPKEDYQATTWNELTAKFKFKKIDTDEAKHTDLLIIGAGPAGCSVARSTKDKDILLVDLHVFPRDKPCSGLLVEESQELLRSVGIPKSVFGKPAELDLRYVDIDNNLNVLQAKALGNTERKRLDEWLLKGIGKNVKVMGNTSVTRIVDGNPVKVYVVKDGKEQVITAKTVVGADGATSITRKLLGFPPPFRYWTAQNFIRTETKIADCQFIYWSRFTDWYMWALQKEEGIVEVGGALPPNSNREVVINALIRKLGIQGQIIKKRNWLLTQPRTRADIVLGNSRNVFLAGEAAGLISPSTGEGISFGLRSGLTLAKVLSGEGSFNEYERAIQPLVSEVIQKAEKARMIANPVQRAKFLNGGF
jgi:flavin-dependent dehydrogenase